MNKMAEMNKKVEISKKTVMLQSMLTMLILVLMMFCEAFSVQASDQFSGEKSQTVVTADTKTMPNTFRKICIPKHSKIQIYSNANSKT